MIIDTGLSDAVGRGISQGLSLVSLLDARKERDRRAELAQEQLAQRAAIAQMQQDARDRGLDIREYLGQLQSEDRNRGLNIREDQFNQKQTALQAQADAMAQLLGAGGGIGSLQMLGTPPEQPGGEWRAPMALPQGTPGGGTAGGLGIDPRLMRNLPPHLQAEIIKRGVSAELKSASEQAVIDRNLKALASSGLTGKMLEAATASVMAGVSPEAWLRKAAETQALDDYEQGIQNATKPMPDGAVGPPEPLFTPEQRNRAVQMARLTGKPLAGSEARRVLGGDEQMSEEEIDAAAVDVLRGNPRMTMEDARAYVRSRERGLVNQRRFNVGMENNAQPKPLTWDPAYRILESRVEQAQAEWDGIREGMRSGAVLPDDPGAIDARNRLNAAIEARAKYSPGQAPPPEPTGVLSPDGGLSSDRIVQKYSNPASGAGLPTQQAPASGPQLTPQQMQQGYAQASKEFADEFGIQVSEIGQLDPQDQVRAKAWLKQRILDLNTQPR